MSWMSQGYLPTITGLDLALWAAVYLVWRYLATVGRRRAAAAAATCRPSEQYVSRRPREGRWAMRATTLERMQGIGVPSRQAARRLRRAA